jgi:hypothetical protein
MSQTTLNEDFEKWTKEIFTMPNLERSDIEFEYKSYFIQKLWEAYLKGYEYK